MASPETAVDSRRAHVEARIHPSVLHLVEQLFAGSQVDGILFLWHFLQLAQTMQLSLPGSGVCDVAIISVQSVWDLCTNPNYHWPHSYDTTSKYFRLLCAIGVFIKPRVGRKEHIQYHFPLREYCMPENAIQKLDELVGNTRAKKYHKVSSAARVWKGCLHTLTSTAQILSVEKSTLVDSREKQLREVLTQIQAVLETEHGASISEKMCHLAHILAPHFLQAAKKGAFASTPGDVLAYLNQPGANTLVDSTSEQVDSASARVIETTVAEVDSDFQESTDQVGAGEKGGSTGSTNLPARELTSHEETSESTATRPNLPGSAPAVDSAPCIDIEITQVITSKGNISIEAAPKSEFSDFLQFSPGEARRLASFVQHDPDAFRAYIALSNQYPRTIIRAAVICMLAHTCFPDVDGTMTPEQDGARADRWNQPRKPGAWVKEHCAFYTEKGLPAVMRVLLARYQHKKDKDILFDLQRLEQRYSPGEFWAEVQRQTCVSDAAALEDQPGAVHEQTDGEIEDALDAGREDLPQSRPSRLGMASYEALSLVQRIEREGRTYRITARSLPVTGGRYVVELVQEYRGKQVTVPQKMQSEKDWSDYLANLQALASLPGRK
jgi:hypothetical protein